MKFKSKRAALYLGLQGMRAGLGGMAHPLLAVVAALVMVSVALFGEGISKMAFDKINPWWRLAPFAVLVFLLWIMKRANPRLEPQITQHPIRAAKAMIWFLSPPGAGKTGNETELEGPNGMASWRMAYEAIAMQMKELQLSKLIVIASADASGAKLDGSFRFFDTFQTSMSKLTDLPIEKICLAAGCLQGVDFENAEKLYQVMEEIYADLARKGYKNEEIIMDITGGQKMPSILGGVVTLVEGRRLQYVSTRDYKIHEYDITFKAVG
jgi:hypothetical protein